MPKLIGFDGHGIKDPLQGRKLSVQLSCSGLQGETLVGTERFLAGGELRSFHSLKSIKAEVFITFLVPKREGVIMMDQEKYKQIRANSWKQAKTVLIGVGVIMLILAGMAFLGSSGSSKDSVSDQQPTQQAQTQTKSQYQYEVLSKRDNGNVENIDVLVTSGETNGQAIALEVKKTCKKLCNINIYDDKKAFELQTQYDEMMDNSSTQPSDLQAWKKTNYVFVGDHLIGYMEFSSDTYDEYPYKDWYYKELKGE